MIGLWNRAFLEERSTLSLSLFRPAAAAAAGAHVILALPNLGDNRLFAFLFLPSWVFFLAGLFSRASCVWVTLCCWYFYAQTPLHVGTLSWGVLLSTLFLMCLTNYHGDYFSLDSVRRADPRAYAKRRPYFVQRLLQLQIAGIFFYAALNKFTGAGSLFLLLPFQLLLFVNPEKILAWVEKKRAENKKREGGFLFYDGECLFCLGSLRRLLVMDLLGEITPVNYHELEDLKAYHPDLDKEACHREIHWLDRNGRVYKGFFAFRRLAGRLPMLWPLLPALYLPGMGRLGPKAYRWVADNRYFFLWNAKAAK